MKNIRFATYKVALHVLLHLPNVFYTTLFTIAFPIYKALHAERAYGRVVRLLAEAHLDISARDVFKGIYWNALDSYRGLARLKKTTGRIVYENEAVIRDAIAECSQKGTPIAAISIHQGAFELLHRALCRYSEHVQLITDSVGDSAFRDVLKELRSDPHLTEYHPDELPQLIRNLFKTKGVLAMVVDQGRHTKGNRVTLFGKPSTLYLRLPEKVNRMGAGIVTFRTWTENDRGHRIVIHFEKYYPPHYEENGGDLPAEIAGEVENWIKENPSQWSWNYHKNFTV
jgi:KDO2-lipid IV(A) lauroyltransferase